MTRSTAELLLAEQLRQAFIEFQREFRFAPLRRWRADFLVGSGGRCPDCELQWSLLVEIDGGAYIGGRHSRGSGVEADCEKASAAAILGYRVIRLTPKQVEDGRGLAWIRAALGMEEPNAA